MCSYLPKSFCQIVDDEISDFTDPCPQGQMSSLLSLGHQRQLPTASNLSSWSSFIMRFDNSVLDTQPPKQGFPPSYGASLQGCWNMLEYVGVRITGFDPQWINGNLGCTLQFSWTAQEASSTSGLWMTGSYQPTTTLSGTVFYHGSATMLIPRMVNNVAEIGSQWPHLPMIAGRYSP